MFRNTQSNLLAKDKLGKGGFDLFPAKGLEAVEDDSLQNSSSSSTSTIKTDSDMKEVD